MPLINCPRCGVLLSPRGLGAHQGSTPCLVAARRRDLLARGLGCSGRRHRALTEAGVPWSWETTKFTPGGPGRRSRTSAEVWCAAPVAALVRAGAPAVVLRDPAALSAWMLGARPGDLAKAARAGNRPPKTCATC